jgi:TPR repeat protein
MDTPHAAGGGGGNAKTNHHQQAVHAYNTAAGMGQPLAQHRFAHLLSRGLGTSRNCDAATYNFRQVVERGLWLKELNTAQRLFQKGLYDSALLIYTRLAVIGVDTAQFNAAYILTKIYCPKYMSVPPLSPSATNGSAAIIPRDVWQRHVDAVMITDNISSTSAADSDRTTTLSSTFSASSTTSSTTQQQQAAIEKAQCEVRALLLFGLTAAQESSEALLLMGDFYYYGWAFLQPSRAIAAIYYQRAADLHNTQAIFNLGLMHEVRYLLSCLLLYS